MMLAGVRQAGPVERELLEQRPALAVGQSPGRAAVEVEDVEDLEHDRMAVDATSGEAVAQPREVRAPVVAQAHELTVEDHLPLAECVADVQQLREVIRALAAVARAQRQARGRRSEAARGSRPT